MNFDTSPAAALTDDHPLTSLETEEADLYVKQTINGVMGAIKGMNAAQWRFAPVQGGWSPALIVEHLLFVFDRVLGPLRQQLLNAPAMLNNRDREIIDSIVLHHFPSRLKKFPAPDFALPNGCLTSVSEALDGISHLHTRAMEYLNTPNLRQHALESTPLKLVTKGSHTMLDGYQWLLAATAHAARHTKQILEVKAAPNFPLE